MDQKHMSAQARNMCVMKPHTSKNIRRDYNTTSTFQGRITAQERHIQLLIILDDMLHLHYWPVSL